MVVYGHTPVPEPEWLNRTINIDTGCVFGGRLTALRYPEQELVSVPSRRLYAEPARPFLPHESTERLTAQQRADELLDIEDVLGKRLIETRLALRITIREENAIAALEVMGRFAVDPRWLVYLPPAVSPSDTSSEADLLEHPAEAFAYYRHEGVAAVVCEEKHMGSRAVVIACRDEEAARRHFGVVGDGGGAGVCYTRTGRRFFDEPALETAFLERVRAAAEASGLFDELESDWLLLDCELMPWSAKAQQLLSEQYAAVGAAGRVGLAAAVDTLEQAGAVALAERYRERRSAVERYTAAYRRYCWPVESLTDLKLAPFHLLASEGAVHAARTHSWHLEQIRRLVAEDGELLQGTAAVEVDTTDPASEERATAWWSQLTAGGSEGMVVKPLEFAVRGRRGLVQPAVKVRGREYLRIIYGPEYTEPRNLDRLRRRGVGRKRSLAAREFALGIEALERFVRGEPLRRVHECCFAVLALESEPVDPRL
jgi:protein phosphatase